MEVRIENIKKEFIRKSRDTNIFTAVQPCSLTLAPGTLTVIRGRSGSGKSTLLNMAAGILQPTEGHVYYDGQDLYALEDRTLSAFRNRHIGYIPQGKSAIAALNVLENVLLPLLLFGEKEDRTAQALMERFSISQLAEAMPSQLSGGELRRMAVCRALIRRPEILFADEPTGDLDDENTETVFAALKEASEDGAAVLLVTHEGIAPQYADRVYRMDAGGLYEES